jgi:hypothetical protein
MTDDRLSADHARASGSMPTLRTRDCVGVEPQSIEFPESMVDMN